VPENSKPARPAAAGIAGAGKAATACSTVDRSARGTIR
jgi:hypothetical protein